MPQDTASILPAGTVAPAFALQSSPDSTLRLNQLRGNPVVLVFYPGDWSPVCGDQLALYNEIHSEFTRFGAQLLGISVDGPWCHAAYAKNRKLEFKLLADFEPKGAVARQYGAYRNGEGLCERALFVIDRDAVIRWSYLSPIDQNPRPDGIIAALQAIQSKGATPAS